jgi:hypothetical protein
MSKRFSSGTGTMAGDRTPDSIRALLICSGRLVRLFPKITGIPDLIVNDNVLYHSLPGFASGESTVAASCPKWVLPVELTVWCLCG